MKFTRIEQAIKRCKQHLQDTGTENTEVAGHVVAYLLVFINAEFERRVSALVEARAGRSRDVYVQRFVTRAAERLIRGPKIEQLVGILESFDSKCPETFRSTCGDQAQTAYNNIVTNRHLFVHGAQCNVTMADLEKFFHESHGVFAGLVAALGLRASEIKHLS